MRPCPPDQRDLPWSKANFWRPLFPSARSCRTDPEKHDRTQDLILDLRWIFEQRADLRPFMRGFSALVSLFGHGQPFLSHESSTNECFPCALS